MYTLMQLDVYHQSRFTHKLFFDYLNMKYRMVTSSFSNDPICHLKQKWYMVQNEQLKSYVKQEMFIFYKLQLIYTHTTLVQQIGKPPDPPSTTSPHQ